MQIRRFLGNIARAYLAIGALSATAFAVADEYPIANNNWGGYAPQHDHGFVGNNNGYGNNCWSNSCCEPVNEGPQCAWGYNPPAYLHCGSSCNNGFLDSLRFRADFLWWRASEDCLDLGFEQTLSQFGNTVSLYEKSKKPNFKYDPGFRLGLATVCDCVDIALNWTHFHTKAKSHGFSDFNSVADSQTRFYSCWEKFNAFTSEEQKGRWNLDLDLLDLEVGHKYFASSCFVLRPHLGLRGARIDQGFHTFNFTNSSIGAEHFVSKSKSKSDFLGLGPRLGVDAEWRIGCGLSLFGQAAGAIVFGKFDNHARELLVDSTAADFAEFNYNNNANSDRTSRAITDLSIGLKWEHCFEFCCHQHPFSLVFAWEHHGFYNFNNFNFRSSFDPVAFNTAGTASLTPSDSCSCKRGDLFTQGLTVSAEIGF